MTPARGESRFPWRLAVAAGFALAAYALFLNRHVVAVAAGSDSSGYLNHARLLASGHVRAPFRSIAGLPPESTPDNLYVPLGFRETSDKQALVPTYPAGLALLILALEPLAGWRHVGNVLMILHALAGVSLTYALGRVMGLDRRWAVLGAAAIASSPLYLYMSFQLMTDVPALVWTTAAVIAAWRSRERSRWALAAGAMVALDVLVRPTNMLVFLPVAVALGASPRRWLLLALGGMPGAVFFGVHSRVAYGNFFSLGYEHAGADFSWSYVPGTLHHYVHWLPVLLTPIAILTLGLPWIARTAPRKAILLGLWIAAFAAFYSAYVYTHETWWYLRFLLPAAPAIVVAGLLVAHRLCGGPAARLAGAVRFLIWAAALTAIFKHARVWIQKLPVLDIGNGENQYAAAANWVGEHVPHNSLFLTMQASGALFYYTDFTLVRWDWLQKRAALAPKIEEAARQSGRPIYAVLFPFEVEDALRRTMPGNWTKVQAIEDVTIWRRDSGATRP